VGTPRRPLLPLLDDATAAFVQGGVSILASTCDGPAGLSVARAVGCRVSADRQRVTILVPGPDPFLEAVASSGRIAVAFTQPSTHRAIQLKGDDAALVRRRKDDPELSARYVDALAADGCPLGYTQEFMRALTWSDPATLTAVAFRPAAAFVQTPGPHAGEPARLGGSSSVA